MSGARNLVSLPILAAIGTGLIWWILGFTLDADIFGFTGGFLALALLPHVARPLNYRTDVFQPYLGTAVLLYLYSLSTLLFVRETGLTYYAESVASADLQTYRWACLLAVAGLALGTTLASTAAMRLRRPQRSQNRQQRAQTNAWLQAAAVLGVVALPIIGEKFAPWSATNYAEIALSLRINRLADQSAGLQEVFLEAVPTTWVLCAATVVIFDRHRAPYLRLLAGLLLMAYITTTLLSGWRGQLMVALLLVVIYFHYRVRSIRLLEVALGGLSIYLLINVLSVARASANPVEMLQFLMSEIGDRGFEFLALQQSGELATSTNLLRLIEGIRSGEAHFGWGAIGLGQLAAFVPRTILPDRPEIASEMFVKIFYPGIFESGGGYGFFMPQDGYWDFGLAGVFVYCAVFAFLIERGYRWLRQRFEVDLFVFLYALLYSQLVLSVIRSGLFASLKAGLIAALPVLLLLGWFSLRRRRLAPPPQTV